VDRFLAATEGSARQIISLGAGTDTRVFRLLSRPDVRGLLYHEVDFANIIDRKAELVKAAPIFLNLLSVPVKLSHGSWTASSGKEEPRSEWWGHGHDLRDLTARSSEEMLPGIERNLHTLVISECCLCYLQPEEADAVLQWFTSRIQHISLIVYEPIHPHDAFGMTMTTNLASRGIIMPTVRRYPDAQAQEDRLKAVGMARAWHATIDQVWETWVPGKERDRVNNLEGLDEVEEWQLLASHYIVVSGERDSLLEALPLP
jgi:[phosphatase 2A protein]-leucine-carboxy methyltransferase